MATVLDKTLKRQVTIDGAEYIVAIDAEELRLTRKGGRKPQVELRWRDLVNGDAALAVALNASLSSSAPRPAARGAKQPAAAATPAVRRRQKCTQD